MTTAVIARHSRSYATRLSAFYAASFLVVGVQLPFWPVWLAGRGLDAHQIAAVFAAAIWAKVFATPLLGALADRLGRRRAVMIALAATASAFYAGLWPVAGFWAILALNLVAGMAQSAVMPLGDSITLAAVRDEGLDYGRVRVWGSITFILAAIGSGWALGLRADAGQGGNQVLALVLVASGILLAACIGVPAGRSATGKRIRWAALAQFAADRRFWLFVISAAALQSSHQLYYGFGTLIWRQYGLSDGVIGVLWAEGVLAEIALFWCSAWLVARFGPLGLMAAGGIAGILRWSLMGLVPGLAAAAVLQLLHAATFGASHLGAMHFLSRQVPPDAAASAQSLYSALSAGFGSGLVMLAAGALYTSLGGQAYLCMAVLSGLGLLGALWLRRTAR
jgi:PPP family 3-phenylpropionic acid transporter